jgi:LPS-assembly lipoprotein
MSWSRRGAALAVLFAAGCGFTPALAPSGPAAGLRGEVEVVAPVTRSGYFLTRRLEERLGLPATPAYRLRVQLTQGAQVTGIPADRVTARAIIVGQANWELLDIASGRVIERGDVQSFTGLSSTSTTAATREALADANQRLMVILADRIVADLLATAPGWRA